MPKHLRSKELRELPAGQTCAGNFTAAGRSESDSGSAVAGASDTGTACTPAGARADSTHAVADLSAVPDSVPAAAGADIRID